MSSQLIVAKFGGTSMGSAQAMEQSARVALQRGARFMVVSATSGTTNQLLGLIGDAIKSPWSAVEGHLYAISSRHLKIADDLALSKEDRTALKTFLLELETLARGVFLLRECSARAKDRIQSIGELLSSELFAHALKRVAPQRQVQVLDARDVMITDDQFTRAVPIPELIAQKMMQKLGNLRQDLGPRCTLWVSQGFIGRTEEGETTTLGRGGSDYSASLFAEAMGADICEIWTDVAGIATTDPRICPKAQAIAEITFQEAAEMAIFGAKVLHPTTLTPARRGNISVFVGNTFEPDLPGTWIRENTEQRPLVRALALKKGQTLLTLSTPKMLNAYGFLLSIFKIFSDHRVAVDAITTSEISVAMTVDESVGEMKTLLRDLGNLGEVQLEKKMALCSLIGNNINSTAGLGKKIFGALENVNVRMICQGASLHNFCFLVDEGQGEEAVRILHRHFLE